MSKPHRDGALMSEIDRKAASEPPCPAEVRLRGF
jgi:hypothetical protein